MSIKKKLLFMYTLFVVLPMIVVIVGITLLNKPILDRLTGGFAEAEKQLTGVTLLPILTDLQEAHQEDPEALLRESFVKAFVNDHDKVMRLNVSTGGNQRLYAEKYSKWPEVLEKDTSSAVFHFTVGAEKVSVQIQYLPLNLTLTGEDIKTIVDSRIKWAIIGYFIAHTLFILYVGKYFLKPFKDLKEVAQKVEKKDYDFHIDIYREDEIGETFRAFDKMRTAIKQFENSQKEFVANISHDLKTPITAIKGYISALEDGVAKDDPVKFEKYLSVMNKNTQHLDHLVDDLFLLAKLDVDQVAFNFIPVSFNKYIEYIYEDLQITYEGQLAFHLIKQEVGEGECLMDAHKMRRVILNLVDNAYKHMNKPHKHVAFIVKETLESVQLTIVDNGKGIPKEDLNKIFNRFYRVESNRNTELGGTGLGLSISQQIIEKHHGHLYAKSALGAYTAITIELPKLSKGEKHV